MAAQIEDSAFGAQCRTCELGLQEIDVMIGDADVHEIGIGCCRDDCRFEGHEFAIAVEVGERPERLDIQVRDRIEVAGDFADGQRRLCPDIAAGGGGVAEADCLLILDAALRSDVLIRAVDRVAPVADGDRQRAAEAGDGDGFGGDDGIGCDIALVSEAESIRAGRAAVASAAAAAQKQNESGETEACSSFKGLGMSFCPCSGVKKSN